MEVCVFMLLYILIYFRIILYSGTFLCITKGNELYFNLPILLYRCTGLNRCTSVY